MITVAILINGQPIYTRSAVNVGNTQEAATGRTRRCRYELDDGSVINHWRHKGAVALAKTMLDTIIEVKRPGDRE